MRDKLFKYLKTAISIILLFISAEFSNIYYGDEVYGMCAHIIGMICIGLVYFFYVPKTKEARVFATTVITFLLFSLSAEINSPLITTLATLISIVSMWMYTKLENNVLWRGLPPFLFCSVYVCFVTFLIITYRTGAVGVFLTFLVGMVQAFQLIYIDKINKELYRLLSAVMFIAMMSCKGGLPGLISIMPIALLPLCNIVIYECAMLKDKVEYKDIK